MRKFFAVYAVFHTLILPESSIIIWRGLDYHPILIFLIVFSLGNLFIALIFWRKAVQKILPAAAVNKAHKIISVKGWFSNKAKKLKDKFNLLTQTQRLSFWLIIFVASGVIVTFLPYKVTLGLLLFAGFYLVLSALIKRNNIPSEGHLGIAVGALLPVIPGPRQAAILIVAQRDTLSAKLVFFSCEAIRIIFEIMFLRYINYIFYLLAAIVVVWLIFHYSKKLIKKIK